MPSMDTLVEALACPSDMSGSTQGLAVNVDMIVCVFSLWFGRMCLDKYPYDDYCHVARCTGCMRLL